ncbi:1-acyl-sn-glycerol-3-phosphate acyltransferase [Brumimicrobium mesophilum]|uniref:1-acyl-sn-glycerol-3-phosphate acyltransferase n=1 Tax=Brumimicrobium mesophilum TaxID=392717 RepID=UPI000D144E69|nr:1-acyl-sn-glycerol-3-phosphate acyltransferase [Brumimicrobium mesophilum]
MRILYFLMKFILKITLWVYYPRFRNVNQPKKRYARTIYMSNHAASFMDPLAVVGSQRPIVFFMTRSDIFKPFLKPILWASHMLPIYRKHDGEDTKAKNEEVFKECARLLKGGRSIIVFAEGFTDDVFIRRLKSVKKGAVRIGFLSLERINWKKKIYLQAVGANYSEPNTLGSDCVVSNGDPICLNDYKEAYEKDPSKTILDLTLLMEKDMRKQITDVRKAAMAPFHENVMRITRKGMNAVDSNFRIPLLQRWEYSRNLAIWFNENKVEENKELMVLKQRLEDYFTRLKKEELEETPLYKVENNLRNKFKDYLFLFSLAPVMILGVIHCYLPYKFIKNFIEKSFKRKVFWGSVKMLLGFVAIALFNIPIIILLVKLLDWSSIIGVLYFMVVLPISGVIAYKWFEAYNLNKKMNYVSNKDVSKIVEERNAIEKEIQRLIPVS